MVSAFNEFINKKIVVFQKDGYTRYGVLISTNTEFITIKYDNGRHVVIATSMINRVEEAKP